MLNIHCLASFIVFFHKCINWYSVISLSTSNIHFNPESFQKSIILVLLFGHNFYFMILKNSSTIAYLGEYGGKNLALIFNLDIKFLVRIAVCTEALSRVIITLFISIFNMHFKIKFIIQINS